VTVLSVGVGAALVALVAWDIVLTILHPSARGPLSYVTNRLSWVVVRELVTGLGRRRHITAAGPLAMLVNVLAWVGGLWLGFALIYLPFVETLAYDAPGFGSRGMPEALYLSAVALSTVGFGDVVAPTDALRLITVLEAASGLAAFTAAITYVISVYPLVSSIRGIALRLSDLQVDRPEGATRLLLVGGERELAEVHRGLIETHENIRRFPVLYYFHAPTLAESVDTMLRGSAILYLVFRWGLKEGAVTCRGAWGPALQSSLVRLIDDFEADYIGGVLREVDIPEPLDEAAAREWLASARRGVAAVAPDAAAEEEAVLGDLPSFLARAETFLFRLATENRSEHRPLLEGDGAPE
jgi:Ion channel